MFNDAVVYVKRRRPYRRRRFPGEVRGGGSPPRVYPSVGGLSIQTHDKLLLTAAVNKIIQYTARMLYDRMLESCRCDLNL